LEVLGIEAQGDTGLAEEGGDIFADLVVSGLRMVAVAEGAALDFGRDVLAVHGDGKINEVLAVGIFREVHVVEEEGADGDGGQGEDHFAGDIFGGGVFEDIGDADFFEADEEVLRAHGDLVGAGEFEAARADASEAVVGLEGQERK
jgi:hypothetical protein